MLKKNPRDAVTEAYIAFGGPILGTIGALAAFVLGVSLESQLMLVIANVGFFLNLINLLPIHPLDGGRISTAVTRWLWLVGLVGGLVVVVMLKSILFFIIWALFAWELYQKYVKNKGRGKVYSPHYVLSISLDHLRVMGAWIPGEEHKKDLTFSTYSTLDGIQMVRVFWEALGIDQTIALSKGIQGLIHKVHVVRIVRNEEDLAQPRLDIHIQLDYEAYQPDDYYEVPPQTRWNFGMLYAGLVVFLIFMLYTVHAQGIPSLV
jgi:membrane-associated protease RseP (regulator of RpoE activity)